MFFDPKTLLSGSGHPANSANPANFRAPEPDAVGEISRISEISRGADSRDSHIGHRLWLVTLPDGSVLSVSRTPPATLAEIQADYPGATIRPEPELAPGPALQADDMGLAFALLRHWNETDMDVGQEWLDGLARDPERLKQMYAEVVRLGIATYDAPEPVEDAAATAVCAACLHWTPNPTSPATGLGRCLTDAPASRRPGSLWPWLVDAEVRCREFAPKAAEPETSTKGPTQ